MKQDQNVVKFKIFQQVWGVILTFCIIENIVPAALAMAHNNLLVAEKYLEQNFDTFEFEFIVIDVPIIFFFASKFSKMILQNLLNIFDFRSPLGRRLPFAAGTLLGRFTFRITKLLSQSPSVSCSSFTTPAWFLPSY